MKHIFILTMLIQVAFMGQTHAQDNADGLNIASFFIKSNKRVSILCQYSIEGKAPKEVAERMKGIINEIDRVNSKLRVLEGKINAGPKTIEAYQKITAEVFLLQKSIKDELEESAQFDYPTYVSNPIGGAWPIWELPVRPPNGGDCEDQGEAIKNDCLIAAEMLENCGAIDSGEKTVMQLGCQTAGQAEENACEIAAMQDSHREFNEGSMRLAAEVQCRKHEEIYGSDNPPETQTNSGN